MDSRTALLNAPRRRRRAAALLAPALVALLVLALAAAAAASLHGRAALLDERRAELGRLEALLAVLPPAGAGEVAGAGAGAEFLEGGSDVLVQATFQTRLREIAAAAGAEVIAVGNLPITIRADTRFAGLRASLSGSNDALVAVIFAIETSRPYLTIRNARIDTYPAARGEGPQELMLQVEFEGALRPDAAIDAAPGPADGEVPGDLLPPDDASAMP